MPTSKTLTGYVVTSSITASQGVRLALMALDYLTANIRYSKNGSQQAGEFKTPMRVLSRPVRFQHPSTAQQGYCKRALKL